MDITTIDRLCPNCKIVAAQLETVKEDRNTDYKLHCTNCDFEYDIVFGKELGRKIIEYDNRKRERDGRITHNPS